MAWRLLSVPSLLTAVRDGNSGGLSPSHRWIAFQECDVRSQWRGVTVMDGLWLAGWFK
jgi:hypothetical protein